MNHACPFFFQNAKSYFKRYKYSITIVKAYIAKRRGRTCNTLKVDWSRVEKNSFFEKCECELGIAR